MKRIALLLLLPLNSSSMQKCPPIDRPGTPMPIMPSIMLGAQNSSQRPHAKGPAKMLTVSVNVWHNDPCDQELWNEIETKYYALKTAQFSTKTLFGAIAEFVKLTEEKKGKALWGALSFTEVLDSQVIDEEKSSNDK